MYCAAALCAGISSFPAYASSKFDPAYYAAADRMWQRQYCGTDEASLCFTPLHEFRNGGRPQIRRSRDWRGDSLELTDDEQIKAVWTPVPIAELANYKSIKKRMTDAEFEAAYQEALKIVTPA